MILVIGVGVRDTLDKLGGRYMPVINQQQLGNKTIYQHQSGNSRYYTVSGDEEIGENERLASVSTVLGMINKPGLVSWAVRLTKEGLDHTEERDRAAEVGTNLHKAIQLHLDGELSAVMLQNDMVVAAMLARWIDWYKQSGITITATEKMVYHPELKYAGTLDAMGHDNNGNLVVLDWKSGGLWPEMALQLAAYGAAIRYHANVADPDSDHPVRGILVGLQHSPVEVKEVDDMSTSLSIFGAAYHIYTKLKDTKAISVWRK